jgi:hypothetical protein
MQIAGAKITFLLDVLAKNELTEEEKVRPQHLRNTV